jgi:hypothetical protein
MAGRISGQPRSQGAWRIAGVVLAALAIAWITGCGGGSNSTPSAPLSLSAFIRQGNAICRRASVDREVALLSATKDPEGSGSDAQLEGLVGVGLESVRAMTVELSELSAPEAAEGEVAAIVQEFNRGADALEMEPRKAFSDEPFVRADVAAAKFGLTDCRI